MSNPVKYGQAIRSGRAFDRLVNFSDGVVAVAVTVLVLPLLEVSAPQGDQTVWDLMRANWHDLISYVITFWVIVSIWLAHHRTMDRIRGYDGRIVVLNTIWLATIAFLPWPTSMLGDGTGYNHGVGVLYFGTLAVNNLALSLMATHIEHRPEMWSEDHHGVNVTRGYVFTAAWVVMALVSEIIPDQTLTIFVLIWVVVYAVPPIRRIMQTKD